MFSRRTLQWTSAVLLASFVSACATQPDRVQAAYVSPLQYASYNCDQVSLELQRLNGRVIDATGAQKRAADNDAVAMGVGLILFWPALFFIPGSNQEGELSRLKGEYEALEIAAIQKNCAVADQLKAAREQRAQATQAQDAKREDAPAFR